MLEKACPVSSILLIDDLEKQTFTVKNYRSSRITIVPNQSLRKR